MQTVATEEKPEITLSDLAREALAGANGRTEVAVNRLLYRLKSDQALLKSILEASVRLAVYDRTQQVIRNQRQGVMANFASPPVVAPAITAPTRANVVALAQGISACLLDFPLAGGRRLRDAPREEVLKQADRYEKTAGDMSHKARWLRLIGQSVPDGAVVGAAVSEERAQELFEQTRAKEEEAA